MSSMSTITTLGAPSTGWTGRIGLAVVSTSRGSRVRSQPPVAVVGHGWLLQEWSGMVQVTGDPDPNVRPAISWAPATVERRRCRTAPV